MEAFKQLIGSGSDSKAKVDAFLNAIVETTPECIKIVAPNGDLLHMNAAGLQMIEAESWEQVAGACTFNLITDEYRTSMAGKSPESLCR